MLSLENDSVETVNFNTKKVASVITAAAGLAVAGVVISTKETKTGPKLALINIPKEFSGTFTNSHDDGRYTAQGIFHKFEHEDGDWQIDAKITAKGSAQSDSTYMVYTLKDDIFIQERFNLTNDERLDVHCMEPQGFPTYGQGKEIFKKAVSVEQTELTEDMVERAKENCEVGAELSVVNENGKPWVICGDYSNQNFEMTLMGNQITLHAKAVEGMVVDIEYPEDYDLKLHNCTDTQDPLTHWNDLIRRGPEYEHRALDVETKQWPFKKEEMKNRNLQGSPLGCIHTVQKCYVAHGVANAGMNVWDPNVPNRHPVQKRNAVYDIGGGYDGWGYPEGYDGIPQLNRMGSCSWCNRGAVYGMRNFNFAAMSRCEWASFIDTDTQHRGYKSNSLHVEYKNWLETSGYQNGYYGSQNGEGRCGHLMYVATHSMGGMIMQAALIRDVVQRRGFQWYQVQNPWYGAISANNAYSLCNAVRYLSKGWVQALLLIPGVGLLTVFIILSATGVISVASAGIAMLIITAIQSIPIIGQIIGVIMIILWIVIYFILLVNMFGQWNLSQPAINTEVCMAGLRLGKNNNGAFPLPANMTIEFHKPWKFQSGQPHEFDNDGTGNISHNASGQVALNQNTNKRNRAPNMRMCGNHPWGFATQYENNAAFKHNGKSLEHAQFNIRKKYDIVSDQGASHWRNPRTYTGYTAASAVGAIGTEENMYATVGMNPGRWANLSRYRIHHYKDAEDLVANQSLGVGNMANRSGFWSDGAVDVTNCMAYALYAYSSSHHQTLVTERLHLSASNHDSGTCRSGKATQNAQDPCQIWEEFFDNNSPFYNTYEQMPSFYNGYWTPIDSWIFLYGSAFWSAGQTMDIWGGQGPPTVPPTPFPTHNPKNVDENGMYIGTTYSEPPPMLEGGDFIEDSKGPGYGGLINAEYSGKGPGKPSVPSVVFDGGLGGKGQNIGGESGIPNVVGSVGGYNIHLEQQFLSKSQLQELEAADEGRLEVKGAVDLTEFQEAHAAQIQKDRKEALEEQKMAVEARQPIFLKYGEAKGAATKGFSVARAAPRGKVQLKRRK